MIHSFFFLITISGCSVSSSPPSSGSREEQVRQTVLALQSRTQSLYEQAHKLESDIDEIRRNSPPRSQEAIEKLEQDLLLIRSEHRQLQVEFSQWKQQLVLRLNE